MGGIKGQGLGRKLSEETRRKISEANKKHRMGLSREYSSWSAMRNRCSNKNNQRYFHYGARGITVCERWNDFLNFYTDMGERPEGTTIDRIDNNKGYFKENCRWATNIQQANNKSNNRLITYKKETKTLPQWAEIMGINKGTLLCRLNRGWSIKKAMTTLIKIKK